ncbi:MAG: ATP-binding cassette domain-containing protein [Anaerolineae bacterium]|nr:ATP-binding cassette domain-containing protein [Anaerolineae bacterium]
MTNTVEVSHLNKSFGKVQAVKDVSFEVQAGEIFGLLGPNGAGKTTTLRMMMDIFKPNHGEISILGGRLDEEKKNRIGYMPEERGLYRELKLETVIIYLATLKGLSEAIARQRLDDWLQRFDLYEHHQKKVKELSKGMQQKAQLIATLIHNPDLIIIDEPFSGLDPVNTRLVKDIMEEQRQEGKTIIMSTHQMHQVEALCNRIVLINDGESILYGEVNAIKRDFAGDALQIAGQGDCDFTQLPGVLESRRHNGTWQITLGPETSPQAILRRLLDSDEFKVEHFKIAEPSLEDIFVSVVKGAVNA